MVFVNSFQCSIELTKNKIFLHQENLNKIQPHNIDVKFILIDATGGGFNKFDRNFFSSYSQNIFILVKEEKIEEARSIIHPDAAGIFSIENSFRDIICLINLSVSKKEKNTNTYILNSIENVILESFIKGYSNKKIASQYNMSPSLIKYYASNIFKKLNVKNRTQAALLGHKIIV